MFTCLPCDEVKLLPTVSYLSSVFSVEVQLLSTKNLISFFFFRNSRPLFLLGLYKLWLLTSNREQR